MFWGRNGLGAVEAGSPGYGERQERVECTGICIRILPPNPLAVKMRGAYFCEFFLFYFVLFTTSRA